MQEATLEQVKQLAEESRESIWSIAKANGHEPKIYLHWTAVKYGTTFPDYHINITGDGKIYVSTTNFAETKSHTWRRNSGSLGIALCCAYGAGSADLGSYPPTAKQIEVMAQVINAVASAWWLTIDKDHVLTHGEAANNEDGGIGTHNPYAWWNDSYQDGDTRGDLEYLGTAESPAYNPWSTNGSRGGDVLRGKANWYKQN